MKKLFGILLAALFLALPLMGDWYWNKYTGKLDYYVGGSASPFSSLYLWDTNQSNKLIMSWYENDVANRNLYILVNGGNRTINLSGDFTLSGNNQVANWTATTAIYSPFIYGGTGIGGDLNLYSTSNATKGTVTVNDPLEIIASARNLKTWWNFEDFLGRIGTTGLGWVAGAGGTGATSIGTSGTSLRPGIWELSTGTTAAGYTYIYTGGLNLTALLFGGGVYTLEADIYITTLSTVTETYAIRFGFGDSVTATPIDGAYFYYTDAGANPNWYRNTVSNTVLTSTNTTVAAVAGAWTRLKIVVNADATSVEFFINGVSVGSNVANIPSGAGRNTAAIFNIIKSAGTTARIADIDWAWLHIDLMTSR